MKLEDFVAETLMQIVKGVATAQQQAAERGAQINPSQLSCRTDQGTVVLWDKRTGVLGQQVEFDVAVTAVEDKKTKGGVGVFVGPLALGSQGESGKVNQSVTRIKFSVPVLLPTAK